MKSLRIAAVQCSSNLSATTEENLSLIERHLKESKKNGADLVVFPEGILSGYALSVEKMKRCSLALQDSVVKGAVRLSAKYGLAYAFGMFERSGSRYYNSALLAYEGELIGLHRKVHATPRERGFFNLGDRFDVYSLPFVRVGMSICYDNEMAESQLCLGVKGAELILMPAAWADHWEREDYIERCNSDEEVVAERRRWMYMMFGARCRDTGTFSVLANYAGTKGEGPWRYVGKSMIFAPTGKILAEARAWQEEVIYANLDATLLEQYRRMDAFWMNSRRPDVYHSLVESPTKTER